MYQAGIWAWRLPLACPTLSFKVIRISPRIIILLSGTFAQTLNVADFLRCRHGTSTVTSVVSLVRLFQVYHTKHPPWFTARCLSRGSSVTAETCTFSVLVNCSLNLALWLVRSFRRTVYPVQLRSANLLIELLHSLDTLVDSWGNWESLKLLKWIWCRWCFLGEGRCCHGSTGSTCAIVTKHSALSSKLFVNYANSPTHSTYEYEQPNNY